MAVAALLVLLLWLLALCLGVWPHLYNVVDYQAAGNGNSDDTDALLQSWRAACADSGNPTFLIPSEKTFLLINGITFKGPCKSSIHVEVGGSITAPNRLWTNEATSLITFRDINHLTVRGGGQIAGQGSVWWRCLAEKSCTRPPYTLSFIGCDDLQVSGIGIKDSPAKQMAIDTCVGVHVEGVTITAPGDSPNTDGIVIAHSQHVLITASIIGTGDDCIAIGPGSSDVNISQIRCGPGHGISIGSLGRDGDNSMVEKIRVSHCHIFQAMTGVRIKTWQGGSGFARDILFQHINITSVETPIVIDQYYNPAGQRSAESSSVAVSNVQFVDLHGSSVHEVAISLVCSKGIPCEGIVMKDVSLYWEGNNQSATSLCRNAHLSSIGEVIPQIHCLNQPTLHNNT